MDDPSLDRLQHLKALVDLEKLNRIGGSASLLWSPLRKLAQANRTALKVLDIGTGGGDIPRALESRARKSGLSMRIDGCDRSHRAVEHARNKAQEVDCPSGFFQLDAVTQELPESYDIILCSLLTHHMDENDVILLMKKMSRAARQAFFINDLSRSHLNLLLVKTATRLLSNSPVVQYDGPASVLAAYTAAEMKDMAAKAGLSSFRLNEKFPCRLLLEWYRNE